MKPTLRNLRKDQQIWALVEDVIALNEVIINFGGDLVRVKNQTDRSLRAGQRVLVMIEEMDPLKLKLVTSKIRRSVTFPNSIDVEI